LNSDDRLHTAHRVRRLPVHSGALARIPRAVAKKFGDDLHPGDCFANTSGYHGNTHCATSPCARRSSSKRVSFSAWPAAPRLYRISTPTTYVLWRAMSTKGIDLPLRPHPSRRVRDITELITSARPIFGAEHFYGRLLASRGVKQGQSGSSRLCAQIRHGYRGSLTRSSTAIGRDRDRGDPARFRLGRVEKRPSRCHAAGMPDSRALNPHRLIDAVDESKSTCAHQRQSVPRHQPTEARPPPVAVRRAQHARSRRGRVHLAYRRINI